LCLLLFQQVKTSIDNFIERRSSTGELGDSDLTLEQIQASMRFREDTNVNRVQSVPPF
jgi:hypothetical protein